MSKANTGHGSHHTTTAAPKEVYIPSPAEIKSSLLQHAENSILSVYHQQEEGGQQGNQSLVIACYLAMAKVCLVQYMPSLAANCALAAMRVIQNHSEQEENSTTKR